MPRLYFTAEGGGVMWRMGTIWRTQGHHALPATIILLPSLRRTEAPAAAIAKMDALDDDFYAKMGCTLRAKRAIRIAGHDAECRELQGCSPLGNLVRCASPADAAEITYVGPDAYLPEFYDILSKAHSSK